MHNILKSRYRAFFFIICILLGLIWTAKRQRQTFPIPWFTPQILVAVKAATRSQNLSLTSHRGGTMSKFLELPRVCISWALESGLKAELKCKHSDRGCGCAKWYSDHYKRSCPFCKRSETPKTLESDIRQCFCHPLTLTLVLTAALLCFCEFNLGLDT